VSWSGALPWSNTLTQIGRFTMEPRRDRHATLVDLLDRVLNKGLVINADIIISVAGIPLLGVNLRAALAGMETMLKYGIMKDWDKLTRERTQMEWEKKEPIVTPAMHGK